MTAQVRWKDDRAQAGDVAVWTSRIIGDNPEPWWCRQAGFKPRRPR